MLSCVVLCVRVCACVCRYSDPTKETDVIVFQVPQTPAAPSAAAQRSLELIDTPFMRTFDAAVFARLHRDHSIPAFISQITLNLFERSKQAQARSSAAGTAPPAASTL